MSKITVLFPTLAEARPFITRHPDVECRICGVGTAECAGTTAMTICDSRPDLLILAGIAGAYPASGLHKGDCVIVTRENIADLGTIRDGQFMPLPKQFGSPASENYYTSSPAECRLRKVVSNTVSVAGTDMLDTAMHADIENMEGAGFLAVCNMTRTAAIEIRCISNFTDEPRDQWIIPEAVDILSETIYDYISGLQRTAQ